MNDRRDPAKKAAVSLAQLIARYESWLLWAVIFVGLALRLFTLGTLSIISDEAMTYFYASLPLKLLWTTPVDTHPPAFYSLIKVVMIFGESEIALRLLSGIAGAATIPVVFFIGRMCGGASVGIVAAAALALSGLHIEYSQEARSYALVMLFVALAVLFGLRSVVHSPHGASRLVLSRDLTLYGLFAGLAVITHLVAIYYVFGLTLGIISYCLVSSRAPVRWRDLRLPWGIIAVSLLVAALWIGCMAWMKNIATGFSVYPHFPLFVAVSLGMETVGTRHIVGNRQAYKAVLLLLCMAGAFFLYREKRFGFLGIVLSIAVVAPAMIWLTGFIKPIYVQRTILPSVIGASLCIGALTMARGRFVAAVLTALFLVLAVLNLAAYYSVFDKENWRGTMAFVRSVGDEDSALIVCSWGNYWPIRYYSERSPRAAFSLVPESDNLLFELDEGTLRAHMTRPTGAPNPENLRERQRLLATRWPHIATHNKLFQAFNRIWVIESHCDRPSRKRMLGVFLSRLRMAGFTATTSSTFTGHRAYDPIKATQFVRQQ